MTKISICQNSTKKLSTTLWGHFYIRAHILTKISRPHPPPVIRRNIFYPNFTFILLPFITFKKNFQTINVWKFTSVNLFCGICLKTMEIEHASSGHKQTRLSRRLENKILLIFGNSKFKKKNEWGNLGGGVKV